MNYKEIKSYEDACKALDLKPISDEVFNVFGQDAKTMTAYHKLSVITRAINEGWQPDWSDKNEDKYEPYIFTNSAGLACARAHYTPSGTYTYIGSRLCFCDFERATFAVETFGDTLYKDYFLPENYTADKEQESAEEEIPNVESEKGGDTIPADAPEYLRKVGEIAAKQIEPLLAQNKENRAIIIIAAQDNGKNRINEFIKVEGQHNVLTEALARFFQHKNNKELIKSAQLRVKFSKIFKDIAGAIKDIIDD